jgi:hypothetical protein
MFAVLDVNRGDNGRYCQKGRRETDNLQLWEEVWTKDLVDLGNPAKSALSCLPKSLA